MSDLPRNEELSAYCQELKESGNRIKAWMPWPDYSLRPNQFPLMTPLRGGREFFNLPNLKQLLEEDKAILPTCVGSAALSVKRRIVQYRSWIKQLQGGPLREGVGEGYRDWVQYLRNREDSEEFREAE